MSIIIIAGSFATYVYPGELRY